jgi:hypothetical protein
MKLIATILALAASSVAAYPIKAPADVLTVERKLKIEFNGGFNGLCDREVIADINALVLETFNAVLKDQDASGFQYDTVTAESEQLSTVTSDGQRKLQWAHWDWVSHLQLNPFYRTNQTTLETIL